MAKSSTIVDPLLSPTAEFMANPYPTLATMRSEAPVFWSEKGQYFILTRYADVHEVVADRGFEKGAIKFAANADFIAKLIPSGSEMISYRTSSMLLQNPPDHTRLRGLVNKAFTPKMVADLKPRIETITNELIEAILAKSKTTKQFDLIADFAFPLPAIVIAEMLGVPPADRDKFKEWSHTVTIAIDPNPHPNLFNLVKVTAAYKELVKYFKGLIEQRRKEKRDDLISALVSAEEEGSRLSETELLANCVLLLIAGHETTSNLIGNGSLALLRNPDQLELLKGNLDLLPTAIDEFLRYDCPVQMVRRVASENMEVRGVKIPAGKAVVPLIGAANRDPEVFDNPDKLDITRQDNKHIAFGHGIHHCLGWSLAKTEGQTAIGALLKAFPDLQMKTDKVEVKQPFSLRGVKQLQVAY